MPLFMLVLLITKESLSFPHQSLTLGRSLLLEKLFHSIIDSLLFMDTKHRPEDSEDDDNK